MFRFIVVDLDFTVFDFINVDVNFRSRLLPIDAFCHSPSVADALLEAPYMQDASYIWSPIATHFIFFPRNCN